MRPNAHELTADQREFCDRLFAGHDGGFIEVRALPSRARTFCPVGNQVSIARFLAAHAGENLHVGVASRIDASSGALENCAYLSAAFADFDYKTSREPDVRRRIAEFPLSPGMVVASGGGLHVYWVLKEPMNLRTDAARARTLLRRLAHHLGADLNSAEPARVLRIPDTFNHKYDPPRRVHLEECRP